MPIPPFLRDLRRRVGTELVLLPGVAAVVPDRAGRVLCLRRSDDGRWALPSGIVEPGEEPSYAVARETYEEAGVVVRPEAILAVSGALRVTYPNGDRCEFVTTLYRCAWVSGEPRPLDGEASEVGFFAPEALPHDMLLPNLPAPLPELLAGSGGRFPWDDAWWRDFAAEAGPPSRSG